MPDAIKILFEHFGVKDKNGNDYTFESMREAIPPDNDQGNRHIYKAIRFLCKDNRFKAKRKESFEKGPENYLFSQKENVYLVVVSFYNEKGEGSDTTKDPPVGNRHAAIYFAKEGHFVDAHNDMKIWESDRSDKNQLKQMMIDKWNENKKAYKLCQVWRVKLTINRRVVDPLYRPRQKRIDGTE